ncbi:hypothetical protein PZA11_007119 [Diplocarpon coronariae]
MIREPYLRKTIQVFVVLWTEPTGSGATSRTFFAVQKESKGFDKLRRFLLIDNRKGHSICLPIMTYQGKATTKNRAHPEDHAPIIPILGRRKVQKFSLPRKAGKMTKQIKVDVSNPADKFDPLSRLNYSKVYTVEHNVKVRFIGQVNKHYEQQVMLDYNDTHGPIASRPHPIRTSRDLSPEYETSNAEGVIPDSDEKTGIKSQPGDYTTETGEPSATWQSAPYEDNHPLQDPSLDDV